MKPVSDNVQVIEMTAKKYVFSPSPIHVKKGAKVELKIRALDKTHGFKIALYPEGADGKGAAGLVFANPQASWSIQKNQDTLIEFTAEQPGTYNFKCAVFCGFGHGGMKGQIIVDP